VNPVYPSVITIGRVEAGSAANVIAEEAYLEGTIRTTVPEVRDHLHAGMQRMVAAFSSLHNANIDIEINQGYPPVVNTALEARLARQAAEKVVGIEGLMKMDHPSMGAEDFAYYLQEIPGCYVRFGARIKEYEYIPLHSPEFDVDEDVLKVGADFFDQLTRDALDEYQK
jgi:metal-dependent amidase/aminoacylase/carboxypeptidase family protein